MKDKKNEIEFDDLKWIKKHYGEKMMQLCRELFPTILEYPGELSRILDECFNQSRYLYHDIVNNQKKINLKNLFTKNTRNMKKK